VSSKLTSSTRVRVDIDRDTRVARLVRARELDKVAARRRARARTSHLNLPAFGIPLRLVCTNNEHGDVSGEDGRLTGGVNRQELVSEQVSARLQVVRDCRRPRAVLGNELGCGPLAAAIVAREEAGLVDLEPVERGARNAVAARAAAARHAVAIVSTGAFVNNDHRLGHNRANCVWPRVVPVSGHSRAGRNSGSKLIAKRYGTVSIGLAST
jgi:hypothetical protein